MLDQGGRRSVTIIEDDPGIRNALALTLQGGGFHTAELSGTIGLEGALAQDPFLVLLDLSLTQTDAVEVLKALAKSRYRGAVQLISGSSRGLLEDVNRVGQRYGIKMLPVLRKPFRMRQIRQIAEGESERPERAEPLRPSSRPPVSPPSMELGAAIRENLLTVHYQPKYDMATGLLIGAECLARVRHPSFGLLSPASFLPGASPEDMVGLTTFVVRQACSDWPAFMAAGIALRLAVNVPGCQLTSMPLAELVRDAAPAAREWSGLMFEITEEEALRDVDAVHEVATQLIIYGHELSIDDFGVGYSSLARLRAIPFREIKLDRSLVDGCAGDKGRAALCRAVVDLAHSFDARVVGEGIERPEDLSYLKMIGCDVAQGFLLGRPMDKASVVGVIETASRGDAAPGPGASKLFTPAATVAARRSFGLRSAGSESCGRAGP